MTPHNISRLPFRKYCGGVAAALAFSQTIIPQIAQARTSDNRPPVLWLHFSECTGCSESFLRAADPDVTAILLDVLNVTYHETIQVACGDKAEFKCNQTVLNHTGEFICIAESLYSHGGQWNLRHGRRANHAGYRQIRHSAGQTHHRLRHLRGLRRPGRRCTQSHRCQRGARRHRCGTPSISPAVRPIPSARGLALPASPN